MMKLRDVGFFIIDVVNLVVLFFFFDVYILIGEIFFINFSSWFLVVLGLFSNSILMLLRRVSLLGSL